MMSYSFVCGRSIVQNHTTEIGCPAEAFVYLLDTYWNDELKQTMSALFHILLNTSLTAAVANML